MREGSVKSTILKLLERGEWRFGGQIEDEIRATIGAKASNASRRCRELVGDGKLEERYVRVSGIGPLVVQYRRKEPKVHALYIPIGRQGELLREKTVVVFDK